MTRRIIIPWREVAAGRTKTPAPFFTDSLSGDATVATTVASTEVPAELLRRRIAASRTAGGIAIELLSRAWSPDQQRQHS